MTQDEAMEIVQNYNADHPQYHEALQVLLSILREWVDKDRRFVVVSYSEGYWCVLDKKYNMDVGQRIPEKAGAQEIADIYERIYKNYPQK